MFKKIICAIIPVCMMLSLCSCKDDGKATETAVCLDTIVTITCYGEGASDAAKAGIAEVQRIESILSPYIETSEIYKINKNAASSAVETTDEVCNVLTEALRVCELTDGAFDITVKPLVDLWNITGENPTVPSEEDINKAKAKVDYRSVKVENGAVSFEKADTQIDLGGAGKGYATDCVVEVLKNHGIKNALIDLGGNIFAMGLSEKGRAWRIGLQAPDAKRGEYFKAENLSDNTCVTSGSYERYFESDGKIYHHILDPKTGYSADAGLISVSVIGSSSFEADMLSTAIFIMGAEEFEKIRDNFGNIRYYTVDKTNNWQVY